MILRSLLLLPLLLLGYVIANDVGLNYDPDDEYAWENKYGSFPYRSYRSTHLVSPVVRKTVDSPQCYDDNYIFLAPRGFKVDHPAVTILDNHGDLVWTHYVQGEPYNLKVQEYKGEKVLTFWVGDDAVGGHGEGWYYVYNSRYEQIAKIRGANSLRADLHELTITSQGTALVTFYQVYPLKQSGIFKMKDTVWIWDCLFQEFDIATNDLIFEWRASEHHQLNETYQLIRGDGFTNEHPYDWYHINGVEKDDLGNYLISARFTSTITYINGTSGDIIWILGGKRNFFQDLSNGQATNMQYQHLARFHPLTAFPHLLAKEIATHGPQKHKKHGMTKQLLTAFDNGVQGRASRGVLIELTYPTQPSSSGTYTARLVQSYNHPSNIASISQGSLQLLPSNTSTTDPRILIGYGHVGVWTEYTATGTLLCSSHISPQRTWGKGDVQSYTALKFPWSAEPHYPPNITLSKSTNSVFVSWNGATGPKSWSLQTRNPDDSDAWIHVAMHQKTGFETQILLPEAYSQIRFVRLLALDEIGNVMATFPLIDLWATKSYSGRITGMLPMEGNFAWVIGLVLLMAVIVTFRQRSRNKAFLRGYEKVRKH